MEKSYRERIDKAKLNLEKSVKEMSSIFPNCDLMDLVEILNEYDNNVQKHYEEYKTVNEIWNKIKYNIKGEKNA